MGNSQSVRKLFAMCCEFRNAKNHSEFRNAKFRNAKNHSEFRNAKNHIANFAMRKTTANFAMRNFAMRKTTANFAMRNFAKDFDVFVRQMNSVLWLQNFAMRKENFAMPNGCQLIAKIPVLLFFSLLIFNICSKICTKLLKLKQEKLHKGTN